jgi:hypothetical protein
MAFHSGSDDTGLLFRRSKGLRYCRTSGPMTEADPASARPKPSRMDFLPRSMTSGGMSENFVLTMNSATDFVSPGAFGNSAAGAGAAARPLDPIARVDNVSEFLNISRRFITACFPSLCPEMKYRKDHLNRRMISQFLPS